MSARKEIIEVDAFDFVGDNFGELQDFIEGSGVLLSYLNFPQGFTAYRMHSEHGTFQPFRLGRCFTLYKTDGTFWIEDNV